MAYYWAKKVMRATNHVTQGQVAFFTITFLVVYYHTFFFEINFYLGSNFERAFEFFVTMVIEIAIIDPLSYKTFGVGPLAENPDLFYFSIVFLIFFVWCDFVAAIFFISQKFYE